MKKLAAILLLLLSWNTAHAATPVYKQAATGAFGFSGTSLSASFTALPATNDSVYAVVLYRSGTSVTVTDNQSGNTYTVAQNSNWSGQASLELVWCGQVTAPSGTFTVNVSGASLYWEVILDASGLSGAVDNGGDGFSISPLTTWSATAAGANTNANDLVIAAMLVNSSSTSPFGIVAPSTGYTEVANTDSAGNGFPLEVAYKIVSSPETSTASWTWTTSSPNGANALVASFKGAGSASTPVQGGFALSPSN